MPLSNLKSHHVLCTKLLDVLRQGVGRGERQSNFKKTLLENNGQQFGVELAVQNSK